MRTSVLQRNGANIYLFTSCLGVSPNLFRNNSVHLTRCARIFVVCTKPNMPYLAIEKDFATFRRFEAAGSVKF